MLTVYTIHSLPVILHNFFQTQSMNFFSQFTEILYSISVFILNLRQKIDGFIKWQFLENTKLA